MEFRSGYCSICQRNVCLVSGCLLFILLLDRPGMVGTWSLKPDESRELVFNIRPYAEGTEGNFNRMSERQR